MRHAPSLLLLSSVALGIAALTQSTVPPPPRIAQTLTIQSPVPTTQGFVSIRPTDGGGFAEQLNRPLFRPGRRPPLGPVEQTPAEPEQPFPVDAALGVIVHPAGASALLRLLDASVIRVREGDDVAGWTVSRIDAEGVGFVLGDLTEALSARVPTAPGVMRLDR